MRGDKPPEHQPGNDALDIIIGGDDAKMTSLLRNQGDDPPEDQPGNDAVDNDERRDEGDNGAPDLVRLLADHFWFQEMLLNHVQVFGVRLPAQAGSGALNLTPSIA
jgi:hypothetical protein